MDTKKILYYYAEYDDDYECDTLYLTTKDYCDANEGYGWDQQFDVTDEPEWLAEYPMGPQLWQDLKKIGLDNEIMESTVVMRDSRTDNVLSIQEVKDKMKELGWTLLPYPDL